MWKHKKHPLGAMITDTHGVRIATVVDPADAASLVERINGYITGRNFTADKLRAAHERANAAEEIFDRLREVVDSNAVLDEVNRLTETAEQYDELVAVLCDALDVDSCVVEDHEELCGVIGDLGGYDLLDMLHDELETDECGIEELREVLNEALLPPAVDAEIEAIRTMLDLSEDLTPAEVLTQAKGRLYSPPQNSGAARWRYKAQSTLFQTVPRAGMPVEWRRHDPKPAVMFNDFEREWGDFEVCEVDDGKVLAFNGSEYAVFRAEDIEPLSDMPSWVPENYHAAIRTADKLGWALLPKDERARTGDRIYWATPHGETAMLGFQTPGVPGWRVLDDTATKICGEGGERTPRLIFRRKDDQ